MIVSERMSDFLTNDMLSLVGIVVGRRIEVSIIHLGRTLGYMQAATSDADGSEAQPAVIEIIPLFLCRWPVYTVVN